jgi:hypothetical protein
LVAILAAWPAVCLLSPPAALAADDDAIDAQAAWRDQISATPTPSEGCFVADYPSIVWTQVECIAAPDVPYVPALGSGRGETVGNGHDYAASMTTEIIDAKGSFPHVSGVTSEEDDGISNAYSLQLNSNFMKTAVCNGHSQCQSWQQFVYSTDSRAAFIQYWLINWDASCPGGWNTFGSDCWKNSSAVGVPLNPIKNLVHESLFGSATKGGNDHLTFTGPNHAYNLTTNDNVVDLASGWKQAEFNIIGDGGGSEAVFNAGSHVTVRVQAHHGATGVLSCASNAGTTGETNNLNLGACSVVHGANPYIQFTESN